MGKLRLVFHETGNKLLLAQIPCRACDKAQVKYYAPVIENILQIGFNAMDHSAVYHEDIPFLKTEGFPVQPRQAAALVNADNLHFLVPVIVQRMKDNTVICIGFHRQFKGTMSFQFFQGFIHLGRKYFF